MPLATFIVRRLLGAVPLLLGVVIVNFALIQLAPGDPVSTLVGDFPAPPDYIAQMRHDYGLDQPLPVRLAAVSRRNLRTAISATPSPTGRRSVG